MDTIQILIALSNIDIDTIVIVINTVATVTGTALAYLSYRSKK